MDQWPFWMFEENIKIVNQLTEEEEKARQKAAEEKVGKKEISLGR